MEIRKDVPLAPFTSFGVGGSAENYAEITNSDELSHILGQVGGDHLWILGQGTNVLISDKGLPGTTLRFVSGKIEVDNRILIADAGASWDDLVKTSIDQHLWGIEFLSGIPGSVGAAVYINISAYGQSQADRILWVESLNKTTGKVTHHNSDEMTWGYKQSIFQQNENLIIAKVAYKLSEIPTKQLTYQAALDVAHELMLDERSLNKRRQIILETRKRAGSIYLPNQGYEKTVGSFFRNPIVSAEQAKLVATFDESQRTAEQIANMNKVHGGNEQRVSASHVLLATGFKRGQAWGPVRLHPKSVLKIENTDGATAQQIYDVAQLIIQAVKDKLDIILEPEAKILGEF